MKHHDHDHDHELRPLAFVRSMISGMSQAGLAMTITAMAAPAAVYFGTKIAHALPKDARKDLLDRLLDLVNQIQDDVKSAKTQCDECSRYGYGYMLRTPVWQSALTEKERDELSHGRRKHMLLCPMCVCDRLGRPLTHDDFDPKYPINWPILCAFELADGTPDFAALMRACDDAEDAADDDDDDDGAEEPAGAGPVAGDALGDCIRRSPMDLDKIADPGVTW